MSETVTILHPELEVMTDYGPKLSTSLRTNPFRSEIFQAYEEFYDRMEAESPTEVLNEPIFLNNKF